MDSLLPRIALALAYPWLAHWAAHGGGGPVAALALFDLALVVLVDGLLKARPRAWLVLAALALLLWSTRHTALPRVLLLAPPMLFTGLAGLVFARSLWDPRGALITRIVAGMERCGVDALAPDLRRYTHRLSAVWACVLLLLCACNGVLAAIAVPGGALDLLGVQPAFSISRAQWSLFANLINYGLVVVLFLGEYAYRRRRFPERPYRHFGEFLLMMGRLGADFWRDLFSPRGGPR
ncbi:ketosynthase [Lysobacter sp. SG-8]|uniref:Ketosynthase n=1 Tax=Marilutibacter penaei TaxID=2759900 RepID=A0A7W3U1L2_9GAMM|nr:ketosynthase [Lysobacter penaei]MBB1087252.1 ketosynthase [Lysobacter penaei]